jgi:UDP-N-acetylmuramate: L-alanyl-gamma-D-glutamyl-meso-diaminopimelate ligase
LSTWLIHAEEVIAPGQHVYFIGICGTAMASCAAAMKERGYQVSGSDDSVYPPMSTFLAEQGITIHQGYDPAHFSTKPDWVVIGNALSRGNAEVEHVLANKWIYLSLPELLREVFIRGKRSIVVTGTHGKSTTTSLIAWILDQAGWNPSYLIGGLPSNFSRGARFTDSEWIVLEGDEYDTAFFDKRSKFIHYLPEIGIVHNLEFDHADIFEDLGAVQKTFSHFIRLIPSNGLLLANGSDPNLQPLLEVPFCPIRRYGLGGKQDDIAKVVSSEGGTTRIEVSGDDYELPMFGDHNVENALAAIACARHAGVAVQVIQQALRGFKGLRRRQEIIGRFGNITVFDDFAHHPTAIAKTLQSLREQFPSARLTALFEPRSNTTRRRVLQQELIQALSLADDVLLGEVARASLLSEDQRLHLPTVLEALNQAGCRAAVMADPQEMADKVASSARAGDVIAILSNGGFGGLHQRLLDALQSRFEDTAVS